jgi:hypothetical protein
MSFKEWISFVAAIAFFSLFAASVYTYKGRFLGGEVDRNGTYDSKEEIQRVADELNSKLTYVAVSTPDPRSRLALVNSVGKPEGAAPKELLVVAIQDKYLGKVSVFDAKQYTMPHNLGDTEKIPEAANLCAAIDAALKANDPILKAIQDTKIRVPVSVSLWGVAGAGVEISPPEAVQIEIAAVLRRVFQIKAKKIEVLIKGFADGQSGPWKAQLMAKPYDYNTVDVYMPLEPERQNWFQFIRKESTISIPKDYTNEYLPDLRARYVKEEFVDRFLTQCDHTAETEVHILKGQADNSTRISIPDRKAQIFINIY